MKNFIQSSYFLPVIIFIGLFIGLIYYTTGGTYLKQDKVNNIDTINVDTIKVICKDNIINKDSVWYYINHYNLAYPDAVFTQFKHESNWGKSYYAKEYNNIFGLKGKKGYIKFNNYKDCILYYKDHIQNRLKKNEDYYSFLVRIKYCGDDTTYIDHLKKY